MADKIFPSTNDVGTVAGEGRVATEASLADWRDSAAALKSRIFDDQQIGSGGVLSGFDFSSGDATNITLTAGTAVIRGFKCETTTTISGTLTASTFNFVFLALTKSAGLVTGLDLQVRTASTFLAALGSIPTDSILLWVFETDGSSIIASYDLRTPPSNSLAGLYVGDDAASRTIELGFRPKKVMIARFTTPRIVTWSHDAWEYDGGLLFAPYLFEPQDGAGCVVGLSDSARARPVLAENGFTIENNTPTLAPGGVLRAVKSGVAASAAGDATDTETVTVTGAKVGDVAIANHDGANSVAMALKARVTSSDTVTVYFTNTKNSITTAASSDLIVVVIPQGGPVSEYQLNELDAVYFFTAWY